MKKVLLVGGFHEMIELCESCDLRIEGIIDSKLEGVYYGYPVVGTDDDVELIRREFLDCSIVLTPDLPEVRKRLYDYYTGYGFSFATVISPEARISKSASIGEGVVIQAGVNVSAATVVGDFVKLNMRSNIMHDCIVGDFATVAPDAVVLGRVNIGRLSYIGANCTILPSIEIGDKSIVGAGSVVTRNVAQGSVVKGNPAK